MISDQTRLVCIEALKDLRYAESAAATYGNSDAAARIPQIDAALAELHACPGRDQAGGVPGPYSHRNGESDEPTVSGWYWFDGVGKWKQTPPETISKRPVLVEIDEEGGAIIWYGAHDGQLFASSQPTKKP